ncbi:unnamed protein product [Toxocara canis]|uniref:Uncharacterized protein n=1 Tax=Toxocara canis TaxID=6265 RepID=A0A183V976_TOXCA|nr:unnamed protein product [Toxocara canis]
MRSKHDETNVESELNIPHIMLLSVVVLAIHITTAESADGESCPLEDLDVRTNSTYVIYGVTSDETVFLFSSDDIAKSGRTPRDQLASYLNQTGKTGANRMFPAGGRLEVLYFVQKNYMPWEFHLVIRVRDRFENETDNHGVPRRTRFLRKYNNASFGDVFSVADTDHIRFHLKYTDEHGLHGGIVTWPFIYLFEIERKKHYLRFKTIERPNGYRYTDESRLWNEGDDLAQNSELERLGKEWSHNAVTQNSGKMVKGLVSPTKKADFRLLKVCLERSRFLSAELRGSRSVFHQVPLRGTEVSMCGTLETSGRRVKAGGGDGGD